MKNELLVRNDNDSALKTAVQWGGAALIAYFGSKFIFQAINKDIEKKNTEVAQKTVQQQATTNNPIAAAAQALYNALNKDWTDLTRYDGTTVFRIIGWVEKGKYHSGLIKNNCIMAAVEKAYYDYSGRKSLFINDLKNLKSVFNSDYEMILAGYNKVKQIKC
ncbi:MAG: hypothetical protein U0Y10_17705 [Spirosomataceae bacterium]